MKHSKTFCPAPWVSFYVDPSGNVENCCISNNKLGNLKDQSIESIINGAKNIQIKQDMLNDQQVEGCKNCYNQDGVHTLQSNFLHTYQNLGENFYQDTNNFRLKYLDLRWNNTCNLACIYCGPGLSSLWQEQNDSKVIKIQEEKTELLDYVTNNLADLQEVYLAGGEPLMIKENVLFLQRLLEVNPMCRLIVNTNLSLIENNKVFELLKKFKKVQWLVSCESTDKQYEYIRWPASWDKFYQNLKTILNIPDHTVTFHLVLMNINSLSVWDWVDHLVTDLKILSTNISITLYNLRDSSGPFAIQRLTTMQKDQIRDRISDKKYLLIPGVANLLDSLEDPQSAFKSENNGLEYTIEKLTDLDQRRGLDSKIIFPEIYQYKDSK
jgi:radical SAM protein with 4Fe4S-binding SPASM domain